MDSSVSTVELGLGNVLSWVFRRWHRAPFNSLPIDFPGNSGTCPLWDKGFLMVSTVREARSRGRGRTRHRFWFFVSQEQVSLATWEVPRLGRSILSPPGPAVPEVKVH